MVLRDPYGNRIPRKDGKVMTDNQGIRNAGEWNASAESALVRNGSTSCELLELERC